MLESFFLALFMLFAPQERERQVAERRAMESGCERYSDPDQQRNCRIRTGRATAEDIVPYAQQVTRLAPPDPGMPDRLDLLRGGR